MIFHSNFQLTFDQKEILPIDLVEFPYLCNYVELDQCANRCLPWHWHSLLEFNYIVEGEIEFRTADQVYSLKKGEMFFINSEIMHSIVAKDAASGCRLYTHLFDMHFLSGMYHSLYERKYMLPIMKNENLPAYIIPPDNYTRIQMIEKFLKIVELNDREAEGYEFEIRNELSRLWFMLFNETSDLLDHKSEKSNLDIERLKIMMQYIHDHCVEKIKLDDISASANISNRECSRCFNRCIKTSPMNYLNEHRIHLSTQMLLQTSYSIITISENCGFSSSSYFSKVFQELIGCTPKDYRKKNLTE